jgi:hypothetical protein
MWMLALDWKYGIVRNLCCANRVVLVCWKNRKCRIYGQLLIVLLNISFICFKLSFLLVVKYHMWVSTLILPPALWSAVTWFIISHLTSHSLSRTASSSTTSHLSLPPTFISPQLASPHRHTQSLHHAMLCDTHNYWSFIPQLLTITRYLWSH